MGGGLLDQEVSGSPGRWERVEEQELCTTHVAWRCLDQLPEIPAFLESLLEFVRLPARRRRVSTGRDAVSHPFSESIPSNLQENRFVNTTPGTASPIIPPTNL